MAAAPGLTDKERHRLERLAAAYKEAYVAARRRTQPRYAMDTKRWPPEFWFTVAQRLDHIKPTPKLYVDTQFNRVKPYPWPNLLTSPDSLDAYRITVKNQAANTELHLTLQNEQVQVQLGLNRLLADVLTDASLELSPAFRCCMAYSAGLEDIWREYVAEATEYLRNRPQYTPLLMKYMPPDMQRDLGVATENK